MYFALSPHTHTLKNHIGVFHIFDTKNFDGTPNLVQFDGKVCWQFRINDQCFAILKEYIFRPMFIGKMSCNLTNWCINSAAGSSRFYTVARFLFSLLLTIRQHWSNDVATVISKKELRKELGDYIA